MKRRARWEEPQYDSVLDTMTNVVGILIIIVAVAEIGVGDAIRRTLHMVRSGLSEVQAAESAEGSGAHAAAVLAIPIPDPERAKDKSRAVFMCRYGRVFQVDTDGLSKIYQEQTADLRSALKGRELRDAIIAHFDGENLGDAYVRMRFEEVAAVAVNGRLFTTLKLILLPRNEQVGETLEELAQPDSRYARALAALDAGKQWVYFLVWDDSFETYIDARRAAADAGFAIGWKPLEKDATYSELMGLSKPQLRPAVPD